jgi:hypothetical protein
MTERREADSDDLLGLLNAAGGWRPTSSWVRAKRALAAVLLRPEPMRSAALPWSDMIDLPGYAEALLRARVRLALLNLSRLRLLSTAPGHERDRWARHAQVATREAAALLDQRPALRRAVPGLLRELALAAGRRVAREARQDDTP